MTSHDHGVLILIIRFRTAPTDTPPTPANPTVAPRRSQLRDELRGHRRLRQPQMLMPERKQHLAVGDPIDDRQRVRQGGPEAHPWRRVLCIEVLPEQPFAQAMQLPGALHIRRALQAGEFHGAGQAQAAAHGRHDELALQGGDGEGQAFMFVGQHQVVAAFGVEGDVLAGQGGGEFRRVGSAGDQHLVCGQWALIGGQRDALGVDLPAQHLAGEELHAVGCGGVHQFAHHLIGIEKVPGARKEQPALDVLAQLRRGLANGVSRPERHRHALLRHALLQRVDGPSRIRTLEHQQRAVFA